MPKNANNIKTVVAVTVSQNVANVRITDYIGSAENGADSNTIRAAVDSALQSGITEASVYINSRGGSVFESVEIANELSRFKKVTVRVGALAASAATYLTSKFYTIARPNTQFMIHRPRILTGGDLASIQADIKLLENSTADYIAAYASKTKKTPEAIEAMLAKGDVWMTAQEALNAGFVDAIAQEGAQEVTAEDVAVLEACGAPTIPDLPTKNKNSKMERTEIIAALGLAADSTDEQIKTALKEAKHKADLYAATQASAAASLKARAQSLASEAALAKKIAAAEIPVYAELAESNYEATEKALSAMKPVPKLSAELPGKAKGEPNAAHKDWKMEDYMEKDPEALQKLYDEAPEEAARLEAAYFGSKK